MKDVTARKIIAVVLGNLILGVGIAVLRISQMGNDPYCASNMAVSDGLGIGLGTYQMLVNLVLLVVQIIFGRKYIGIGSLINLFLLGYIVEYTGKGIEFFTGTDYSLMLWQKLFIMAIAMLILTFGLAMYQTANMGIAPYDYLAIGMTDRMPAPYFVNRMITDIVCVCIVLIAVFVRFIGWENSHLGVGTILTAFCLGPLVNLFRKVNEKWVCPSSQI